MVFHNACFFVALFALLLAMSEAYDYYNLPDTPPSVCFKAPERGPCDAELKRWFSNQTSGKCEAFIWGGCKNKRRNNFKTKADCEARCIDPWEDPNKHRDPEGICKLPMDAGYGKMKDVTKYYYSYKYKTCVGFKYLGNGGTFFNCYFFLCLGR